MRQYRTISECLDALNRGCIVDARDNSVPSHVVRSLLKRSGDYISQIKGHIVPHTRYIGHDEVVWFWKV